MRRFLNNKGGVQKNPGNEHAFALLKEKMNIWGLYSTSIATYGACVYTIHKVLELQTFPIVARESILIKTSVVSCLKSIAGQTTGLNGLKSWSQG